MMLCMTVVSDDPHAEHTVRALRRAIDAVEVEDETLDRIDELIARRAADLATNERT